MVYTNLTQQEVKRLFHYTNGNLMRRVKMAGNVKVGDIAGNVDKGDGYRRMSVNDKHYLAHRLIWLWHYGELPKNQLDHINHDKSDNRIENLQQASHLENQRNRSMSKNNKSGFNGVRWQKQKGKWIVCIKVSSERIHLGYFETLEEAISMRLTANDHYGYHGNHGIAKRPGKL